MPQKVLHFRIRLAGDSVYTSDPTFTILWHYLYIWDQALEELYKHIAWLVRHSFQRWTDCVRTGFCLRFQIYYTKVAI